MPAPFEESAEGPTVLARPNENAGGSPLKAPARPGSGTAAPSGACQRIEIDMDRSLLDLRRNELIILLESQWRPWGECRLSGVSREVVPD